MSDTMNIHVGPSLWSYSMLNEQNTPPGLTARFTTLIKRETLVCDILMQNKVVIFAASMTDA